MYPTYIKVEEKVALFMKIVRSFIVIDKGLNSLGGFHLHKQFVFFMRPMKKFFMFMPNSRKIGLQHFDCNDFPSSKFVVVPGCTSDLLRYFFSYEKLCFVIFF